MKLGLIVLTWLGAVAQRRDVAAAPAGAPASSADTPYGKSHLLERIVAVVDKDVVTQGELEAEARVALVLREGERAAQVTLDDPFLQTFLQHLIDQMLVARESRRMGADEVTDAQVDAAQGQLRNQFASNDGYGKFIMSLGVDDDFIRTLVARDLRNANTVAQRMRTRMAGQRRKPAADAAQAATDVKDPAYARALRAWLDELHRAATVRIAQSDGLLHVVKSR